jgi:hypothetical protein
MSRKRPTVIQLPGRVKYHALVLKVLTTDEVGQARTVEILRDEETTSVEDGDHFWIVYADARLAKRKVGGQA